jgi:PKD repeat protein
MNKLFTLIILATSLTTFSQITKKVLFIGNSYTYVNDLPSLIDSIANHNGNDIIKDQSTPGGYTLEGHSTNTTTLTKISANTWDYVVIQEQSQMPSFPYAQVITSTYPYAKLLCDSIRSANECAIPLFYGTWGRRDGDPQWDSINTFEKMNNRLYYAYEYMADANSGQLSPVGIGFRHVSDDVSSPISHTQLYAGDGSHPSIFGSYLGACIFYNMIFNSTSNGNTYIPSGISYTEAQYLQGVADYVTYNVDSLNLDFTMPLANYTSSTNELTTSFSNQSQHAFTYFWDFGDGTNSTEENPSHIYTQGGTYTVILTATNCQNSDFYTFQVTINDSTNSILEQQKDDFYIFTDEASQQTYIKLNSTNKTISIYNLNGQLISELKPITSTINLNILQNGVYFIKVNQTVKKIVVVN